MSLFAIVECIQPVRIRSAAVICTELLLSALFASCARIADRPTEKQLAFIDNTFHVGMTTSEAMRAAEPLDGSISNELTPPELISYWESQLRSEAKGHFAFALLSEKPRGSLLAKGETFTFWIDDQSRLAEIWWECRKSLRADQSLLVRSGLMGADGKFACDPSVANADGVSTETVGSRYLTRHVRFLPPAAPFRDHLDRSHAMHD